MEKQGTRRMISKYSVVVLAALLALFSLCSVVRADNVITANLTATPSMTKPGALVKFQADVIHNPNFNEPAGKRMRIFVTRSDFSWVSDKLDIEYPGMGSVHVNFANGFTIPSNAQSGQTFDFYLVYGPWWVLSNKASVKVLFLNREILKKKIPLAR